ncbi:hypothetical protein C8R47DRAFT_1223266 [Mycena vitilis]|nr:hypothetical protein C8R47DRAFT_1223266 [Mycena vitilis]
MTVSISNAVTLPLRVCTDITPHRERVHMKPRPHPYLAPTALPPHIGSAPFSRSSQPLSFSVYRPRPGACLWPGPLISSPLSAGTMHHAMTLAVFAQASAENGDSWEEGGCQKPPRGIIRRTVIGQASTENAASGEEGKGERATRISNARRVRLAVPALSPLTSATSTLIAYPGFLSSSSYASRRRRGACARTQLQAPVAPKSARVQKLE